VAFDSVSAEKSWASVERRAHSAFEAVRAGTPFADPLHVEVLRDLVVLHYVRSHRYRDVYTNAFETVSGKLRGQLVRQYPEPLRREALRQTRLHLDGSGPLSAFAERLIEQSEVTQDFGNGKLFRTSIEGMFNKVRAEAAKRHLEVLTPESGQFLVGDNPGVSVRTDAKPGCDVVQRPRRDVFQRPQLMKILCLLDVFKWPRGLVCAGTTGGDFSAFPSGGSGLLRLWS
jgi:hypothetical protein